MSRPNKPAKQRTGGARESVQSPSFTWEDLSFLRRIARRKRRRLVDYWAIGQQARNALEYAGPRATIRALASKIGLKEDTLRMAVRFSERVAGTTVSMVLDPAGVPWRTATLLACVESAPDRGELCKTLREDPEVRSAANFRRHLEEHYGRAVRPKVPVDMSRACDKSRRKASELIALLEAFDERLREIASASLPRRTRDQMAELADTLRAARKTVTATLKKLERAAKRK